MLKQVQHDGRGRAVRITRQGISPRLAIRNLLNMRGFLFVIEVAGIDPQSIA